MHPSQVVIIGGGLAAVSAALALKDHGIAAIIIERSSRLGGRAGTHTDAKDRPIDIGQHVYLGCCTEYRRLLKRLGTEQLAPLERRTDFELVDAPTLQSAKLRSMPLPYPFSLAGALLRYSHLNVADRTATLRLIRHARRSYRRGECLSITFRDWLRQHDVSEQSIEALWQPLIVAALNATPEEVSAFYGVMVIAAGLAGGATSASVGIPRAPLSSLLEPVTALLAPDGRIKTSTRAIGVDIVDNAVRRVRLHTGSELVSDAVIIASAHYDVHRLLPDRWKGHPFFARIQQLPSAPIVNVHLWFDRPLLSRPMVGVIRSPLQWLFDMTALHDPTHQRFGAAQGYHIAISLSDAQQWMNLPAKDIIKICVDELKRVLVGARDARLLDATVRKVRGATFSCVPGAEKLRPTNETPVHGLFLAGDYTQTGWPSTMESAVRSGQQAALQVIRYLDSA